MNRLHKRNKKRRIFWDVLIWGSLSLFVFLIIRDLVRYIDLSTNTVLTSGIITKAESSRKNYYGSFEYVFMVGNKTYKGENGYPRIGNDICESFIGKKFPVIYSSKDTLNCKILISAQDFKLYYLDQPDSLKWIK
jgi:hypothetical protein